VFDNHDGIAGIDESMQDTEQLAYVFEMKSGRGLIEDVKGLSGRSLREFGRQLHTLCFAPRQCGGRLAQSDVAESHISQSIEMSCDRRDVRK
jgi:hypothetical protein